MGRKSWRRVPSCWIFLGEKWGPTFMFFFFNVFLFHQMMCSKVLSAFQGLFRGLGKKNMSLADLLW